MSMEGNLYEKPKKEIEEAERLSALLRTSDSLKPEWAEKLSAREEAKKQKAAAELAKLRNASNDDGEVRGATESGQ